MPLLQRKSGCACGGHCPRCRHDDDASGTTTIQPTLRVGAPNDRFEQEADRAADQVMRMPEPRVQRLAEDEEEALLQAKTEPGGVPTVTPGTAADIAHVRSGGGQPLPSGERQFFEPRFGRDFSGVRVHAGLKAAEVASAVQARAFTVGRDVVFGAGEYAPGTAAGRHLMAHELTHVVQQQGARPATTLHRAPENGGGILGGIKQECLDRLKELATKPGPVSKYTKEGCPSTFCQPFADKDEAATELQDVLHCILGGILIALQGPEGILGGPGEKVLPLWEAYLTGGSEPKDLSADFGEDFTASPTTADTTDYLMGEMRKELEAHHAAGHPIDQYGDMPRYVAAREAINTPGHPREMSFDVPNDVAGNIAGGIGTDQRAVRVGAKPSPWDDLRVANLSVNLKPNPDGSVTVTPSLTFVVQDTIDLCPGNCGTSDEQVATIPMSRFEATGLVGDVPFVLRFEAPPEKLTPFDIS